VEAADIARRFTYHAPRPGQAEIYERLRAEARALATSINELCPESNEKSLAVTQLEQSIMWANAAVARHG